MPQRHLILFAASILLILGAFTLGLHAQPGAPAAPAIRTLAEIDPGTPLIPHPGNGATDGYTPLILVANPGYYYLTQNLDVPSGYEGILIMVGGVHIDLRGFSIRGTTGSGSGIRIASPLKGNIIIRNGIVTLMDGHGIDAQFGRNMLINNIAASANAGAGIMLNQGRVRDCVSRANGTDGFFASQYTTFESCSSDGNTLRGFSTGGGMSFLNCTSTGNLAAGFLATSATFADCTALNNNGGGFSVTIGTLRSCGAWGNSAVGISAGVGSFVTGCSESGAPVGYAIGAGGQVTDCTCSSSSLGISITGAGARVERNTLRSCATAITSSVAGSFVFGNVISGATTPLALTGSNLVGTTVSSAGAISASTSQLCNFVQ